MSVLSVPTINYHNIIHYPAIVMFVEYKCSSYVYTIHCKLASNNVFRGLLKYRLHRARIGKGVPRQHSPGFQT